MHFAQILKNSGANAKELSLYKNYFMAKTLSNNSVRVVYWALKGLEILKDQVYFVNEGENHLLVDSNENKLTYSVKDSYGNPASISSIEKVTIVQLDDSSKTQDVTKKAKIQGKNVVVSFGDVVDMKWATYAINFVVTKDNAT